MKILMLSQGLPFPVYRDGLTVRVFHLLKELSRHASCHLVAIAEYPLDAADQTELANLVASAELLSHVPDRGMLATIRKGLTGRRYYSRAWADRIATTVSRVRPDVVLAEQTFMAQYADVLGSAPRIMSAVDAISLAASRRARIAAAERDLPGAMAWRLVAQQRLHIERTYFPKFHRVTTVAPEDANYLTERLGMPVDVIPNGVDVEQFTPAPHGPHRRAVAFSGNLSAPMNEEAALYLIRTVFPVVHARHPTVPLVLVGRGVTPKIRASLPAYVTLRVDVPDMRDALADVMLYVSPIEYGTGIKNSVLQAMAMGIPTVMTPLVGEPIGVTSGETALVARRPDEFVQVVAEVIGDADRVRAIGDMGRAHILRNFAWGTIARRYIDLFEEARREG